MGIKDRRLSNPPHFSRSHQATTLSAGVDSAAAADLWSFVPHGSTAPSLFPHFSPRSIPPSRLAPSFPELSLTPLWLQGGIQRVCAGGGGRVPGEKKLAQSSGHVLCCCSCFLKEGSCRITHLFTELLRVGAHHLLCCRNSEPDTTLEPITDAG